MNINGKTAFLVRIFLILGLFGLVSCISVPNQVSGSAKAGDALALPDPPQPEAQALIARFTRDYALVKSGGPEFFQPAAMAKWPCDISQSTIYEAAELTMADPVEAEKALKKLRNSLREAGLDPGLVGETKYLNVRISPITAICKAGKLGKVDGDAELLAEYETKYESHIAMDGGNGKMINAATTQGTRVTSRVWVRFEAGEVSAPIKSIKRVFNKTETIYDDKETNEAMAKYAAVGNSKEPTTIITYGAGSSSLTAQFTVKMTPKVSAGILGVKIDMAQELQSIFISPLGKNGTRTTDQYSNKEWIMTLQSRIKDNLQHGEQVTLMKNAIVGGKSMAEYTAGARLVLFNGMPAIETRKCFIGGQEVKTANCPKD